MRNVSRTIIVQTEQGLHLRPAAEVSKIAQKFDAIVTFRKPGSCANADSVIELLTLGALHGDELKLSAIGAQAEEAVHAISSFLENYKEEHLAIGSIKTCAA